jgi:6,7-dimethyl-8-ribityllumazine synthase
MAKGVKIQKKNGSKLKIGVVVSLWNEKITSALLDKCLEGLEAGSVKTKNIIVREVPGSYELPFAAVHLIKKEKVDAVICLGALIKGETMHFEYIADAVSSGIMKVQLDTGVPVVFGVLTCINERQALQRSVGTKSHAYEWGLSAIEMALLHNS